jgi:hypothetical protein
MKYKIFFLAIASSAISFAQNNTFPYPAAGNMGIGIPSANFNVQIHGTTDYFVPMATAVSVPNVFLGLMQNINLGKTALLGLTNTTAGSTLKDGLLIRMSELNATIENLEYKNLDIKSGNASMTFSGSESKIWFPKAPTTSTLENNAYINIIPSNENGLFIKTDKVEKYGISVQPFYQLDNAIQVIEGGNIKRFTVQGNGNVTIRNSNGTVAHLFEANGKITVNNGVKKIFQLDTDGLLHVRKIKADADNWADYVFSPNYKLMPLKELADFINKNGHLPNIPSQSEIIENGVDLVEINVSLLEKIEELTIYAIEQNNLIENLLERIEKLENKK